MAKNKYKRPIEKLVGDNRGIVRLKLGNMHCMTPLRKALRVCRPKNVRKLPVPLRRGLILCVIETLQEYREMYRDVSNGTIGTKKKCTRASTTA